MGGIQIAFQPANNFTLQTFLAVRILPSRHFWQEPLGPIWVFTFPWLPGPHFFFQYSTMIEFFNG